MRISLDDANESIEKVEKSEEREAIRKTWAGEKKKLSTMTFREKIKYIGYYYRVPILVGLVAIVLVSYIGYHFATRKSTVLMGIAINDSQLKSEEFCADLGDYLGLGKRQQIDIIEGVNMAAEIKPGITSGNYSGTTQILCYIASHELDFSITDKAGLQYLDKNEVVLNLDTFLPEKIHDAFADRLVTLPDAVSPGSIAIDLTGTKLATSLHCLPNPVYLCFSNLSGHDEQMQGFLEYLYEFENGTPRF